MKNNKFTCCICNNEIEGFPNMADPFITDDAALCCDDCNRKYVFPWRMYINTGKAKTDKKWREEKIAFFDALPVPEKIRFASMVLDAVEKKHAV